MAPGISDEPGNFLSSARRSSATEYGRRESMATAASKGLLGGALPGKTVHLSRSFHFVSRSVRRGTYSLNAQFEFVGVGRVEQSFVQRDQSLSVQVVDRLVKGLHAVLRDACGNGIANQAGLFRIDDAVADVFRRDQNFSGRHTPDAVGFAHQPLRDDGLECSGQQ